jgi:signal transduction histidine kinase
MTEKSAEATPPAGQARVPSVHDAQRSATNFLILLAMGLLFVGGLATPSISRRAGVTAAQGAVVVVAFLLATAAALLAYHRLGGASRVYRFCDVLESFVLSGSIAYLIRTSGTAVSFFWLFHLVQVFMTAFAGASWLYALTISVGPAYLACEFFLRGDSSSGWFSTLAGFSGLYVYMNLTRFYSAYTAALRREAELRVELGRVLVEQERSRISRDLHDNVATELTALVWKVREISDGVPRGSSKLDIEGVAERLRSVLTDLRSVVLALRAPGLGFDELKRILEERAKELCATSSFSIVIDGRLENEELAAFHAGVLPLCFELVHNAATHSTAHRIELGLRIATTLDITIEDDGGGLSQAAWLGSTGGLRGARHRVEHLGGTIALQARARGTRFDIEIPRPLRLRANE